MCLWGLSISNNKYHKCKGPEVGALLVYLKNSDKASENVIE